MNLYLKLIIITFSLMQLIACETVDPVSTADPDTLNVFEKSFKRGLAYNLLDPADLDTLKTGISWWYNWYFTTDAPEGYYTDYETEFIPMLWGRNSPDDFTRARTFILEHSEIQYLLVLNEPNLTDQANQTPAQAASDWIDYEQFVNQLESLGRTIYLVGPAMNWGTMTNYGDPLVWLDAFYDSYRSANEGREPRIDYLAFHWYDYGLESQLDRLQKYDKQIWITEMANWNSQINSYEKQAEQMQQMVAICESRDDVFRYAWFIGRGAEDRFSNLFNENPGDLNYLGRFYINLPY